MQIVKLFKSKFTNKQRRIFTKHIIFCGGLFSDRLASSEIKLDFQIVGFRGDYFKLKKVPSIWLKI